MRTASILLLLLVAAIAVGCDEQNTATEPVTDVTVDFINGPEIPGNSHIARYETGITTFEFDDDRTYLVAKGLGAEDPAESRVCGGDAVDVVAWQDLCPRYGDEGCEILMWLGRADLTIHVYDYDAFVTAAGASGSWDWCDGVTSPRLAQGYGVFMNSGNNFYGSGTRADGYRWKAQGTLADLVNGGCARFLQQSHALYLPGGSFHRETTNISLHHTGSMSCMKE